MRRRRLVPAALAAALALALAGAADAATFRGTVGPNKTITLTRTNGTAVRTIRTGRHTFVVRDRSGIHNFALKRGTALVRRTSIEGTGTSTWQRVRLLRGRYTFFCETHAREMRGGFRVVR